MKVQHTRRGSLAAFCCFLITLASCTAPDESAVGLIEAAKGNWVVVNYWAEWCKPCIKEVPELNALNVRDDVAVLGVNFDGAQDNALKTQIEKLAIAFPTLPEDPSMRLGVDRPAVLPTSLIIDPEGTLIATLVGPQTLETLLAATVNRPAG